jgi:hypothetical protein
MNFLMAPSNYICDKMGMNDENERGMVRMLVNGMILISVMTAVVWYYTS